MPDRYLISCWYMKEMKHSNSNNYSMFCLRSRNSIGSFVRTDNMFHLFKQRFSSTNRVSKSEGNPCFVKSLLEMLVYSSTPTSLPLRSSTQCLRYEIEVGKDSSRFASVSTNISISNN